MQQLVYLESKVTSFGSLYGILNASLQTILSMSSGEVFPANPIYGQPFLNTSEGRLYVRDANDWKDISQFCPDIIAFMQEITAARGEAEDLSARLDVAINKDGSLKGNAPAGTWWAAPGDVPAYVDNTKFSYPGNKTALFDADQAVRITQPTNSGIAHVTESTYNSVDDKTYITVEGITLEAGITNVEYGQPVPNSPKRITSVDIDGRACDAAEMAAGTDEKKFATPKAMKDAKVLRADTSEQITTAFDEPWLPVTEADLATLDLTARGRFEVTLSDDATLPLFAPTTQGQWDFHVYHGGKTLSLAAEWEGKVFGSLDSTKAMHRFSVCKDGKGVTLWIAQ